MMSRNSSGQKVLRLPRNAFGWRDAVKVLPDDAARSYAVECLRGAGFSPDAVAGSKKAKVVLCEALVRIEDRMEMDNGRLSREGIRNARRRLESELYP
jgi:hypothetical protein